MIFFKKESIYNSTQNDKLPKINSRKDVQDLYGKTYKTLLKDIGDLNKWRNTSPWVGIFVIMKIPIFF